VGCVSSMSLLHFPSCVTVTSNAHYSIAQERLHVLRSFLRGEQCIPSPPTNGHFGRHEGRVATEPAFSNGETAGNERESGTTSWHEDASLLLTARLAAHDADPQNRADGNG
jgi:hypothetical protein